MASAGSSVAQPLPLVRLRAVAGPPLGLIFSGIGLVGALGVKLLGLGHLGVSFCVFKATTGMPCFTCGSTRVAERLAALDLPGAFAFNPLAAALAVSLAAWGLAEFVLLPSGRALSLDVGPALHPWLRRSALALLVANWLYLVAAGI